MIAGTETIPNAKMARPILIIIGLVAMCLTGAGCRRSESAPKRTGSVVFVDPDGSSAACWAALRLVQAGPGGRTHWDTLERTGRSGDRPEYSTAGRANGEASGEAFGVGKSVDQSLANKTIPLSSLSGTNESIMIEAKNAGFSVGIINSGHIAEEGTSDFLASSDSQGNTDAITRQIIESGADVIMAGGEERMLPADVVGRHGEIGRRKDGDNLVQWARELGYSVVYTREELVTLPDDTEKVLGLFSAGATFNDETEEALEDKGLSLYKETAPTLAEMTEAALRFLTRKGKPFLLVVQEEGIDRFARQKNARGTLEALRRADAAIGAVESYIGKNPRTLLLTEASGNAGGFGITKLDRSRAESPLPPRTEDGSALDGRDGTETPPFLALPDRSGSRLPFGVTWSMPSGSGAGVVLRAHGLNADRLPKSVDNTDVYRMMYLTLFGKWLE